jgi:hypothetical protein
LVLPTAHRDATLPLQARPVRQVRGAAGDRDGSQEEGELIISVEISCGRVHCDWCHMCEARHTYGSQLVFGGIPRYFCGAFPGDELEMNGRKPKRNKKCLGQKGLAI